MLNSGIVLHNVFSGCHVMTNMCSMMFNDMEWRHAHRYAYVYVCLYVSIYIYIDVVNLEKQIKHPQNDVMTKKMKHYRIYG